MEESNDGWVKAVLIGCSLGLVIGLLVAGAMFWIFLSATDPQLFPQAAPPEPIVVQSTAVGELIVQDGGGSVADDNGGLIAIDPDVPIPTETLPPTQAALPTVTPQPSATLPPTETPLPPPTETPLPTAIPLPSATPVPPTPVPPTPLPPTTAPEQAIVVTVLATEPPAAAPTQASEQTYTAVYTENQIALTLEEIAASSGLLLSNIEAELQDGRVTISALLFGSPSEFVTKIFTQNGELRVEIESATSGGQPLPQELFPLIQSQVYVGLDNELRDEYNYTYLESITIQNGGLIVKYR